MAITNAQQYQQLVNKPANGKRPGYRGSDSKRDDYKTPSGVSPGFGNSRRSSPVNTGSYDEAGINTETTSVADRNIIGGKKETQRDRFVDRRNYPKIKLGLFDILTGGKATEKFVDFSSKINRPFFYDKVIRAGRLDPEKFGISYSDLQNYTDAELEEAYQKYNRARLSGEIDAFGNPKVNYGDDQGDYSISQSPLEDILAAKPTDEEVIEEQFKPNIRLLADGGRAGLAGGGMPYEGGIMDLESGRQMYFLGKLVKKATRGIKKLVKSPIGKAALGIAALQFGPSIGGFLKNKAIDFGLFEAGKGITDRGKLFGAGLLTLAPFLMNEEDTTNQSQMYKGADLPYPVDYYLSGQYGMNRRLVADGGMMRANYQEGGGAEPVAKKTMPLIDMDGKEKDYRETGGFVDMGRMERADDVPARLSKNEFVFTADAVRNAGEGDIDKGAEVMYNMMKNLEAGGEVSEESQGLEGARKMFQTSQRLEEVL